MSGLLHHQLDVVIIGAFEKMGYSISNWNIGIEQILTELPPIGDWRRVAPSSFCIMTIEAQGIPDLKATPRTITVTSNGGVDRWLSDLAMETFHNVAQVADFQYKMRKMIFQIGSGDMIGEYKLTLKWVFERLKKGDDESGASAPSDQVQGG